MSRTTIKLTRGVPPEASFPVQKLQQCADSALQNHGREILQYGKSRGYPLLRELIADEKQVPVSRVVLGQGSLQLQDFCARLFLDPGAVVYVEKPTYDRTLTLLRRARARLVGFPVLGDGIDVEGMERRLAGGEHPELCYVIPDFQNPSGTVLSVEKRKRIADLSRVYGFWIIEDAPYRRLRYRGDDLPSLRDLAPDRVLQISSYSKLISPGLRVGYVVAPDALADRLAKVAEDVYINASYLTQAMIAEFILRDWLAPQIDELKALYRPRLDATLRALAEHMADVSTWQKPDGGFFVGVTVNGIPDTDLLLSQARDEDLLLTDGRGFFVGGRDGDGFIRLPFCALTPEEIEEGVTRLAAVVSAFV